MSLNKKQLIIMWAGIGAILLMVLLPPWSWARSSARAATGYGPIWRGPFRWQWERPQWVEVSVLRLTKEQRERALAYYLRLPEERRPWRLAFYKDDSEIKKGDIRATDGVSAYMLALAQATGRSIRGAVWEQPSQYIWRIWTQKVQENVPDPVAES